MLIWERTKQVDCPNAGTQPPTIGEMAKEEQVQWSSSSKSQVPSDSAKPKRCYKRSHEREIIFSFAKRGNKDPKGLAAGQWGRGKAAAKVIQDFLRVQNC